MTLSAAASVHAEDYDSQIAATNNAISNLASQQEAAQAQVATIQSQVSTLRTQKTELEAKNFIEKFELLFYEFGLNVGY